MKKFWNRVSSVGLNDSLSNFELRSVTFVNRMGAIICAFIATSIFINILIHDFTFIPILSIALPLVFLTYPLNYKKQFRLAKINMMVILIALLTYMSFAGGAGSGLEFYFLSLTVLPIIIFRKNKLIYFFQLICILCLIAQKFLTHPPPDTNVLAFKVFYVVNSFYSALFIIIAVLFFRNMNKKNEQKLIEKNSLIEKKNQELATANKELEAFTYSVSHDLRSPLRSMDGFATLIEMRYADKLDEKGRELLYKVRNSAAKMRVLIEDLLAFSKLGQQEMKITAINTNELIEEILKEIEFQIAQYQTEIVVLSLSPIKGDRRLMQQVFINLLSNAIKYSGKKDHPKIEIGTIPEENQTIFYIKDNGVGFNMAYAEKLFNAFQRLHSQDEYEGTGLGLAIVKNIINRHHGKIWVQAKVNEGATFYFSLPNIA